MRDTTTASNAEGICGYCGYLAPVTWSAPAPIVMLASKLSDAEGLGNVTANPHLTQDWVRHLVTCGPVIATVAALIGAEIAVENTFLVNKRPGDRFSVPAHQDGINDRIQLDPARSVAVWLAITAATPANGCLEIVPGSQASGYLPYRRASSPGGGARHPLTIAAGDSGSFTPIPLEAGQACVMDVRLVHRSGPNTSSAPRLGLNIRYVAPGGWISRDGSSPHLLTVAGDRW